MKGERSNYNSSICLVLRLVVRTERGGEKEEERTQRITRGGYGAECLKFDPYSLFSHIQNSTLGVEKSLA